jgi:large subunit ribosomal protein L10
MALTKTKKTEVINDVNDLLSSSKLTVAAKYSGTTVKAMQALRREARENGTVVKVIKNRLVIKALEANETYKDADSSQLNSMLLYAFNPLDEVAPAQILARFAKQNPSIEFVGAYTMDGKFIDASDVKELADLPSKDQLRAMLVGTIAAPLSGFANVLAGNVRGVLNVLNARSEQLS